jgi:hypothetical protein
MELYTEIAKGEARRVDLRMDTEYSRMYPTTYQTEAEINEVS